MSKAPHPPSGIIDIIIQRKRHIDITPTPLSEKCILFSAGSGFEVQKWTVLAHLKFST